jgi:hypothetical protein
MRDNRDFTSGVSLCLCKPVIRIAGLDTLTLNMKRRRRSESDVGAIRSPFELYSAASDDAVVSEKFCEFKFTVLPL